MNNNTVQLMGSYGGDLEHSLSAWTSTSRDLTEDKRKRIPKLLEMLASNGHETPFEKSSLHFLVTTDISTHIHLIKHRIGVSVNAESARYKELNDDKFYLPDDWNIEPTSENRLSINWYNFLNAHMKKSLSLYHQALEELTPELGRKRAKESARFFLPYSNQITSDVMFNFRSFVHFQRLRNSEHAQKEVRELAKQMLDLVKAIPDNPFKYSLEAFKL